jgi:signal transduction histidine kinase
LIHTSNSRQRPLVGRLATPRKSILARITSILDFRSWPLFPRLFAGFTFLIVLVVTAVTLISVEREQRDFKSELEQRTIALLGVLSVSSADSLYSLDVSQLGTLADRIGRDPEILDVIFYNANGRAIATAGTASAPLSVIPDSVGKRILESQTAVLEWQSDRLIAGQSVTVGRQTLGAIRIELSTESIDRKLTSLRAQGLIVGALAVLVSVFFAFLISRSISKPIQQLVAVTDRFADGDLSQRVPVKTRSEIGQLGRSFNTMARELGNTIAEKDSVANQLQELNLGLEQKVEERTEQLSVEMAKAQAAAEKIQTQNEMLVTANRELAVARRVAEEANELKSQFLATMSHELRTPLNAIIGYADIVMAGMTGELTEEQLDFQQRILANAEHLLGLINDILDLAKIEAGRMEIIREPFNVSDLLQGITRQTEGLAAEKGLRLETDLDPRLPDTLVGDAGRIKQITLNLISNAVKFTDEGYVKIDFRQNGRKSWIINVADTGVGISPTMQQTIFDEFRQIDSSSTRKHGGTGLGLSIVRRFALAMGGNVKVSSKVGEGSTFTVLLPLVEETEMADSLKAVLE